MRKEEASGHQPGKRLASGKADKTPKEKKPKKPSRLTRQQKLLLALAVVLAVGWWQWPPGRALRPTGYHRREGTAHHRGPGYRGGSGGDRLG